MSSRTMLAGTSALVLCMLIVFYAAGPGTSGPDVSYDDIKQKKELESIVRQRRGELEKARAEKARSRDAAAATETKQQVVAKPVGQAQMGTMRIKAAVAYYNWPALVNGNDASGVLLRAKHGAYASKFNKLAERGTRYVDITGKVQQACTGKTECTVELVKADLPEKGIPVQRRIKIAVDYDCGAEDIPFGYAPEMVKSMRLPLGCGAKDNSSVQTPCVGDVCAVRYEGGVDLWPIGFSIPSQHFRWSQSWKSKDFASQIPANGGTYKHTESAGVRSAGTPDEAYFHDYTHSYYCVTRKKAGWDCLRHYEILATGCVPFLVDIAALPANTMAFFPRELVWEAMTLPGVTYEEDIRGSFWFPESFKIDHKIFNKTRYFELASQIQAHARRHLTGGAMGKYIIDAVTASGGPKKIKKILYVHHCYPDFMSDSIWSGLKEMELMGELELVADVVPPKEAATEGQWKRLHSEDACPGSRKIPSTTSTTTLKKQEYYRWLNGWGNHRSHNQFPKETEVDRDELPKRIEAKEFDVVIYGTPTRTHGYMDLVKKHYDKSSVVYMFGGDMPEHINVVRKFSQTGLVFQRELYDDTTKISNELCQDAPGAYQSHDVDCCWMQDVAGTVWDTKKYDLKRWTHAARENEKFTCSTTARFGYHTGDDTWDYLDLKGVSTTANCNLMPKGVFHKEKAPGWVKKCQCLHMAKDVNSADAA